MQTLHVECLTNQLHLPDLEASLSICLPLRRVEEVSGCSQVGHGSPTLLYEGISVFCWLWAYSQRMNKTLLTLNASLPGEATNSFCWALQWDDKTTLQLVMLVLMRYFHPCKWHKGPCDVCELVPKGSIRWRCSQGYTYIFTFKFSNHLAHLLMLIVSCLAGGLGCFTMWRWNSRDFQRIAKNGLN